MKKYIVVLFILFFITIGNSRSQCKNTYTTPGVYPTQLATVYEGVYFSQEIDFTLPDDTVVMGNTVHIDSVKIRSVTGFPGTDINFECSAPKCIYTANNNLFQGCFLLKGKAPVNSAGTYKIYVEIEGYIQTPFGSQVYTIQDSTVIFTVQVCSYSGNTVSHSDSTTCEGDSILLTATLTGKYNWFQNGSLLPDSNQAIYAFSSGKYICVAVDSTGCTDTAAGVNIIVFNKPLKPLLSVNGIVISCGSISKLYQWRINGIVDTSFHNSSFSITKTGYYQVEITDSNGCTSDFSDSLYVNINGVESISLDKPLKVYPNPTHNYIYINSLPKKQVSVIVLDMCGRNVLQQTISEIGGKIDITDLKEGIYIIVIPEINWTEKVILIHN